MRLFPAAVSRKRDRLVNRSLCLSNVNQPRMGESRYKYPEGPKLWHLVRTWARGADHQLMKWRLWADSQRRVFIPINNGFYSRKCVQNHWIPIPPKWSISGLSNQKHVSKACNRPGPIWTRLCHRYAELGASELWKRSCENLHKEVTIEVCGISKGETTVYLWKPAQEDHHRGVWYICRRNYSIFTKTCTRKSP